MAMRDLIPWVRPESRLPAALRDEERSPFLQLRREMDRLFEDFLGMPTLAGWAGPGSGWPTVEVRETDREVQVTAELPGLTEKDVELTVRDGVLSIRGERRSETEDKDRGWSERYYGRFERSVALPDGADESACEATFRDGVLSVRFPRSEQAARARRIPINGGTRH